MSALSPHKQHKVTFDPSISGITNAHLHKPMNSLLNSFFIALLLIQFSFGSLTQAAQNSPYTSCQDIKSSTSTPASTTERLRQGELAIGVGQSILSFLQDNKTAIELIMNDCLSSLNSWTDSMPKTCPLAAQKLLLREIPRILRTSRLALSLASNSFGYGDWQSWDLETGSNPHMQSILNSPLEVKLQPLTSAERRLAQDILFAYWDGLSTSSSETTNRYFKTLNNPFDQHEQTSSSKTDSCDGPHKDMFPESDIIDHFIAILKCKKKLYSQNGSYTQSYILDDITAKLEKFEESRKLPTAEQRIKAAFMIYDPIWQQYRNEQLAHFRKLNRFLLWAAAETFRPIVFIKQAVPTPKDILAAFNETYLLNLKNEAETKDLIEQVKFHRWGAPTAVEELLSYQGFVSAFLVDHSDYCPIATKLFNYYAKKQMIKNIATGVILLAPLVLLNPTAVGIVGPVAAKIIVAGSTGFLVYSSYSEMQSAKHKRQQFLSLLSRQSLAEENAWPDSTEVMQSSNSARLSLFLVGTSFALPMMRPGLLSKLLNL